MARKVFIANNPARPDAGGQWYDIDLSDLFDLSDETVDDLLAKIPAYYHTLRFYAWVSRNTLRVTEGILIAKRTQFSGESKTHIKEYVLPGDHDWAYWKAQREWLDAAVESVKMQMDCVRTYAANRRPESQQHFHATSRP